MTETTRPVPLGRRAGICQFRTPDLTESPRRKGETMDDDPRAEARAAFGRMMRARTSLEFAQLGLDAARARQQQSPTPRLAWLIRTVQAQVHTISADLLDAQIEYEQWCEKAGVPARIPRA